jgi:hypothetical protein
LQTLKKPIATALGDILSNILCDALVADYNWDGRAAKKTELHQLVWDSADQVTVLQFKIHCGPVHNGNQKRNTKITPPYISIHFGKKTKNLTI